MQLKSDGGMMTPFTAPIAEAKKWASAVGYRVICGAELAVVVAMPCLTKEQIVRRSL